MHELSIAESIIDIAVRNCLANGHTAIGKISLSIGSASGVMPAALSFAFEAIKRDTIARGAVLCINNVPISGVCADCREEFTSYEQYILFSCPNCNSAAITITGGFEMDMVSLEVE